MASSRFLRIIGRFSMLLIVFLPLLALAQQKPAQTH